MLLTFLRDPIWTFVSILVALFIGFVSLAYLQKQKSLKRVTCKIISDAPVLKVTDKAIVGKLKIIYNDNKPVNDLSQVILKLENTGNVAIKVEDYAPPIMGIQFSFGDAEILSFEVLETVPPDLDASIDQKSETLILNKTLLNSKDSIKLSILLTKYRGIIKVGGRIVDVKEIKLESLEKSEAKQVDSQLLESSGCKVLVAIFGLIAAIVAIIAFIVSYGGFILHIFK